MARKPPYLEQHAISIRGVTWTVRLYNPRSYVKINGDDSRAITHLAEREIHCRQDYLDLVTLRHEVIHALIDSSHHISSDLDQDKFEEMVCEIVSEHYYDIGKWSEEIQKRFLREDLE